MMAAKVAVFDIDGTLIRWQLYHAIGDQLARQRLIGSDAFLTVQDARMEWKRRTSEESYKRYERQLVKVFDEAMASITTKNFEEAAQAVFDEYKDQTYTYTRNLIKELKDKGYLLFALSGSPETIVEKIADYYGFDAFGATKYETSNGRFTGIQDVSVHKKPELLDRLLQEFQTDLHGSVGIGDSEGDISLLAQLDNPIAFNPSRKLFDHARQEGWPVVIERKNVVYELTSDAGKYTLKDGSAKLYR